MRYFLDERTGDYYSFGDMDEIKVNYPKTVDVISVENTRQATLLYIFVYSVITWIVGNVKFHWQKNFKAMYAEYRLFNVLFIFNYKKKTKIVTAVYTSNIMLRDSIYTSVKTKLEGKSNGKKQFVEVYYNPDKREGK